VIQSKATPGVEAFLSVYSAVKLQSKIDYPKALLVTSTIPGEGKTLISCNLAGHSHGMDVPPCWSTAICGGQCCTGISRCKTTPVSWHGLKPAPISGAT